MDIMFIENLAVMVFIGTEKFERTFLQKILINLELGLEQYIKENNNNLKNFLSHEKISKLLLNILNKNKFSFMKDIADFIANILIQKFNLPWIRIKLRKHDAIEKDQNFGLIIERWNRFELKNETV